ncbi:MAG: mobile mystery protein [Gemmatimonadetes bacterium]|nr:mobile mystery protein [Gemmatimonadota bacterium]
MRKRGASALDRKQLDGRYARLRADVGLMQVPRGGWLRALRSALGMRQRDLGSRLGVSAQAVGQLEAREVEGTVTLGALRDAAHAMGAEVFYVVLPEAPVAATLDERAEAVARVLARQVHHSMRIEDQETSESERLDRIRELKQTLLRTPSMLWTLPGDT